MRIRLDNEGSIDLTRGERIVRGQHGSKMIVVDWLDGHSPVEQNLVSLDDFVVRVCITRPDGEQTGWQVMHKVDGKVSYYYPLQAWDTAVSGEATVSVQYYDCSDTAVEENGDIGAIIGVSQQGQFIIDNGVIAQPMGISNENYDNMLKLITPISNQAFRKFNAEAVPSVIDYQVNGKKSAPALYFNASMNIKVYDKTTNTYTDTPVKGTLIVGVVEADGVATQSEMLLVGNKVYFRELNISNYTSDSPVVENSAEESAYFYDISTSIKDYIEYQITTYGYSKEKVDQLLESFKIATENSVNNIVANYKKYFDNQYAEQAEEFDKRFDSLDERIGAVEQDWFTRLPGVEISDEELTALILNREDGFYVAHTAQFGDEFIFVSQKGELIARYTATGASYQLDKDIMEWVMSAGGGGGSGGGGGGSNMRLTALGNLTITTAIGAETLLTYNFKSSIAGKGTAKYYVNDVLKSTTIISQGNTSFDATQYVVSGSTNIRISVTDSAGSVGVLEYIVNGVELKLSSTFDDTQAYNTDIDLRYTVSGDVPKTIHITLDDEEIEPFVIESTRQQSFTIPALTHGLHSLSIYAVADIEGSTLTSNELNYKVIAYEDGNTDIIIASKFEQTEAMEGEIVAVDYIVYNPSETLTTVDLKINDETVQSLSVDRLKQYWYIRNLAIGANKLTIACGDESISFDITINEAELDIEPVSENLELYLDAYGRSNSEQDKAVWAYNDIQAEFTNFNWSTNGWLNNALRLNGEAKLYIPFKIFENDFRTNGKTIEFEFATRDVATIDTIAIVSYSNNIGVRLKMNEALIQSEQTSVNTKYKDEERIRVSFVIDDKNGLRLIRTFINGVLSGLAQYPTNDNFSQSSPVGITINPDGGSVDIYKIRVYDTALSDQDMLINFIADLDTISERVETYNNNNIFDVNGKVSYSKVKGKIPTVVITGEMPTVKGNKKNGTITYENPFNLSRNFEQACTVDVQGTSSQYYPRKNIKVKLGTPIDFFGNKLPEKEYTIKVNYMESGNRNNTGLANFIHGENGQIYDEKVPPQEENENIRTVIKGEPVAIFNKPTSSSEPVFYAIGQFNNDKGNADTLGLTDAYPNAESWEFRDNDELLCLFRTNDFTRNAQAFEARYPDGNTDFSQIDALVEWVYSTNGDIDKFKAEFEQHFNLHYTLMYYTLTELFGMIDSRAKNMFLNTWDGVIWYPVFYDMDTAFGLNNEGVNNFNYNIEYGDQLGSQNVYNGSSSLLWNNFKEAYADEIRAFYQSLRADKKISAESVLDALDDVTSLFSKALYNVDAGNKYIAPLEEDGDATYLYCAQGDRREHLKWWLDNRFKYLDSKYYAEDYADDYISMRIYSPEDTTTTSVVPFSSKFKLKSLISQYLGVKYGGSGELVQVRADAEVETEVNATNSADLNDKETFVYGASRIKDLGDLSSKYVGTLDVSRATKLSRLVVGNSNSKYSNTNLVDLQIGNNDLLKYLDIRNCTSLTDTLNLSGCKNIQEIYATGTAITSISLAEGGNIKVLKLPATITNLTLKNQPLLTDISLAGVANVSTLVVESCNSAVDTIINNVVNTSEVLSRVRLIGIDWSLDDATIFTKLMACGGIDENNNNTAKSIITGKVHFAVIGQSDIDAIKAYYPSLKVTYTTLMEEFAVTFLDWDDSVLEIQMVAKGSSATDPVTRANNPIATPTRPADAQYTYTYSGWEGTLANVYTDRTVRATYTSTINTYTVNFYNNSSGTPELLLTLYEVPYGTSAKYTGTKPEYQGTEEGSFVFSGWEPSVAFIEGNTEAYAVFSKMEVPSEQKAFADCTWAEIKAVLVNGSVNDSNQWTVGDTVWFEVGDEKPITLTNGETLTIQIADFNHDVDTNGNVVPCTFVTKELMATSKAMNSTSTNAGGWANSAMYSYIQGDVYDMLPADIQALLTPVVKKSTEGSKSTNIISSTDKLFLLSYSEVGFGTSSPYGDEGTQYPIFTDATSRKKYKVGATSASRWWLRSPYTSNTTGFYSVYSNGSINNNLASYTCGVCFAFAM